MHGHPNETGHYLKKAGAFIVFLAFITIMAVSYYSYLVHKVSARSGWNLLTSSAEFSPRDNAYHFRIGDIDFLSNGYFHGGTLAPDLWQSVDGGQSWALALDNVEYDAYAPTATLGGRVFAVKDAVWSSINGKDWSLDLATTPFRGVALGALEGPTANYNVGPVIAHNDHLVFFDGQKLWNSKNGKNWSTQTTDAPFGSRFATSALVHNGRIYLMGGATNENKVTAEDGYENYRTYADVWVSNDGSRWELLTKEPGWSPRMWHSAVSYNGLLWVYGGFNNQHASNLGDLWVSQDGVNWTEVRSESATPKPRHFPTVFTSELHGIVVAAGNTWPVVNDVWSYKDGTEGLSQVEKWMWTNVVFPITRTGRTLAAN